MSLIKSLIVRPDSTGLVWGHFVLRVAAGLMIFYIHGWHKLEGWIAYLQHGTPWKLAEEVAEMHFPAPLASAVAATLVQLVSSLLVAVGFFTRLNSLLLVGVMGVAILQNLLAGRDPQLAVLYTLIVFALALMGGGRFSLDAKWFNRRAADPKRRQRTRSPAGKDSS
jgi:uncharacterized membrane protein YphA (DoxX/SURF4 family)